MHTTSNKAELRSQLTKIRAQGKSIALVPTMGNIHAGHLELVRTARAQCDIVVSTIFVNPLQFGADEDLSSYPRTLEDDISQLTSVACDYLFTPSVETIYGSSLAPKLNEKTIVRVPGLAERFCGSSRPGHFDGVATVVSKLFNLVQPNTAFFGLKDYQQFLIIQKLSADLSYDIEIVGVETLRDQSGLALSSRNAYLSNDQRDSASLIYQCLSDAANEIKQGRRNFTELEKKAISRLSEAGMEPEYFSVCNAENLQTPTKKDRDLVILAAAQCGPSRLIDNIRLHIAPFE